MKNFVFGNSYDHSVSIQAKNLELAINVFKVQELFPENCVDEDYIESSDYDSDLRRNLYKFKDNPMIPISIMDKDRNKTFIKNISLYETIDVNYNVLSSVKMLEFNKSKQIEDTTPSTDLITINDLENINVSNTQDKKALRKIHDLARKKQAELEHQKDKLTEIINKVHEELQQKIKLLYVIETYLGLKEEVYQLKEGKKASENEPLTIHQLKLYMDEEVGIWEDGGMDFESIDIFDEWITKNYKKFLYNKKSICAWQIRRNDKEYSSDAHVNFMLNTENKCTYFLIRNGENLYRIWSNIQITDRFFPKTHEYEKMMKDEFNWSPEEKIKSKHQNYMYGLVALQGLIERTDIFGSKLRESKVNLLVPDGFSEEEIHLIRDAEQEYWIGNGKLTWKDYIKKNKETLKLGIRVILNQEGNWYYDGKDRQTNWRTYPFHPGYNPTLEEIYQIEEVNDGKSYSGWQFKIYYNSEDTIYPADWNLDSHERIRRVPFRMYGDELLNYDEITIEDCEYYEKNRFERHQYIYLLPILHWAKKLKIKEKELEDNFIKFIKPQIKFDIDDEEIREVVKWWKFKNKWKRELTKDDSKAIRMVLKRIVGLKKLNKLGVKNE